MWVIPKNIQHHFGQPLSVPDTEDLTSEQHGRSGGLGGLLAMSFLWRSKRSPSRTWLQRWKRVTWMRLLSGRIYTPSTPIRGWVESTSSRAAILASLSATPGAAMERTIRATCGPAYARSIYESVQLSFFGRTSRGISPSDLMPSSETWLQMVTRQRGAYSRRLKLAHHTSGNGSLSSESWPTPSARDWKDTPGSDPNRDGRGDNGILPLRVYGFGPPAQQNPSTHGSRRESWATPSVPNGGRSPVPGQSETGMLPDGTKRQVDMNHQVRANWPTPRTITGGAESAESAERKKQLGRTTSGGGDLQSATQEKAAGRLNPRWVETLMGLPVGWTMPSCVSGDSRVDELRLLGNGVVPQTAEKAFRTLFERLMP